MRAVVLAMLAGCYSPSATTGAPCDERMVCPSGQVCLAGHCEREGTPVDDAMIDDGIVDAPDAPPGVWSAPVPVGINVGDSKTDASATPDGLTIVFSRNDDLFIATRATIGGAFTVLPLPFSTPAVSDKGPEIMPDGRTIYFASNPDSDYDIFMSTFVNGTWQTPVKVAAFAGPSNEQDVAISPDERTAFVAIGGNIFRSTRADNTAAWPAPASVGVAWGTSPTAPSINAAGDVYFHANNPRDLFVARRTPQGYAAPVPLTEFNTMTGREAAPFVSADDRHIMFERDAELVESSR